MRAGIKKFLFIISLVLFIASMSLIFFFSSQDAIASSKQSSFVTDLIRRLHLEPFVPKIVKGGSLEANVRKLAHMTIYFFLGLSSSVVFYHGMKKKVSDGVRKYFSSILSFLFCFLYACSDELIHQRLVNGRAGLMSDVHIDSLGALVGIFVSFLLITLARFYRKRTR